MDILTASGGLAGTNCWLIADPVAKKAVLFDAPDHTVDRLLVEAKTKEYDIVGLWLTHGHFDHIADHAVVTGAFPGAKVLMHGEDAAKLRSPEIQMRMFMIPLKIPPRVPDERIDDGQELSIGSIQVQVIHTPGHSPGHVCYFFPEEEVLVSGDLIICGAIGRTDLPDSDEDQMAESIRKLYRILPPETRLLPGHCESATLAEELQTNPYVRAIVRG